jgi:hypothetical protein
VDVQYLIRRGCWGGLIDEHRAYGEEKGAGEKEKKWCLLRAGVVA